MLKNAQNLKRTEKTRFVNAWNEHDLIMRIGEFAEKILRRPIKN